MAKPNIPNQKKAYNDLRLRIDKYTLLIEDIYNAYNLEASKIALSTPFSEGVFRFSDFPLTKDKVEKMLEMWRKDMTGAIKATTSQEWKKSNEFQDLLADGAMKYYYGSANGKRKRKYYQTNSDAYQAFIERKDKGMNLSKKIWVQSQDYKEELEAAISTGIQKGMSAVTLSKKVSKYLIDYPLLQKEYKEKFGKATTAKNCEYRSIRLARSEINIAYREAEQKRWSQFDFVVGKEIKISKVHFHRMPMGDLCDELQGKYPKDFPWNGWHPNCFCYEIPILKDEDEFFELEENEEGKNAVKDVPNVFVDWVDRNKDRILRAEERNTLPYFIRDNYNTVKGIMTPNLVLSTLEKAKLRHAARTKEQIQEIQGRWDERKKEYRIANNMANNVLSISNEYPEVSVENLKKYINNYDISSMREESRRVAKQIVDIRKDERMLEVLIPNVHEWKKQFTSAELHEVYDAVEKKIASWSSLSLEKQAEKLKFEWDDFLGGNMKNVQLKYKTWQVSQAAYKRKYEQVLDSIDWQNIDNVLKEALTFKTKSKQYLDLIDELQISISAGDKTKAHSIVADMQAKRAALKRAADARAVKRYGKSADGLYAGGNPFEAGELAKLKDYETRIIDGIMSGRGADHNLIEQYHDYVLQLSEKYYPKQASLFTDEERKAMKAIADKYLARPKTNPNWIWGTDLGGVYSGIDSKVNAYLPKLAGLTREELSIVQRFTNGSTFSNCYNLRNESDYWRNIFKNKLSRLSRAEIKEQYEIIEEWSQGANYTLDRMVRYNGITFRGLNSGGGPELRKAFSQAFKKNKPWVNNASCSTSMKHSVAESFDGDTIIIIHNKTGSYIHAISDYSSEYEIMTLRGTKYKVLAPPKRIGSRYYVELEEII